MKPGSAQHKELFCRSFRDGHRAYDPERIPLPQLDDASLQQLHGVPFWNEALRTERMAGSMLRAFAEGTEDPLLREAIALQAYEEARHGHLIAHVLKFYGIPFKDPPAERVPADVESAFVRFGYGECFDSFFAFGLHRIVSDARIAPRALCDVFDPVLQEEARHIVFFINWMSWKQIQEGRGPMRGPHALVRYAGALWRRLEALRQGASSTQNSPKSRAPARGFTATGARSLARDLHPEAFLRACAEENERRMAKFDPDLLRPRFLPVAAKLALKGLRLMPGRWSRRRPPSASAPPGSPQQASDEASPAAWPREESGALA